MITNTGTLQEYAAAANSAKGQQAALEQTIRDLQQAVGTHAADLNAEKAARAEERASLAACRGELEALRAQGAEASAQHSALGAELNMAQTKAQESATALATLTQQSAAMEANALVLAENIAQLRGQQKTAEREHSEQCDAKALGQKQAEELAATAEARFSSAQTELSILREQLEKAQQQVTGLSSEVGAAKTQCAEYLARLATQQER